MPFNKRYLTGDGILEHLNSIVSGLHDDELKSRYTGFAIVASVTVYETAVKDILLYFAKGRDHVFNEYLNNQFARLNTRIALVELKNYLKSFGFHYKATFDADIEALEESYMIEKSISVKAAYASMISYRNTFTHTGNPPQYATFEEIVACYEAGKEVIRVFHSTLNGVG